MGEYGLIDLFAGVGGLDLAARSLGVPAVGIEWDHDACAIRRAAGLATVEGDVRTFSPADFPHANVLVGGPPFQPFSVAGQGVGKRPIVGVQQFARRVAHREVSRHAWPRWTTSVRAWYWNHCGGPLLPWMRDALMNPSCWTRWQPHCQSGKKWGKCSSLRVTRSCTEC
ncbi:DNA cytosine methyltransferase [Actinacidiphila rubida]|uniref:DNA cytosine methyltransferase n=1 Tax=Actinacidiphila rubida TaxID=310780 RepID=UPI001FE4567C|nr:DNA cytosine methyltransferase [Actinacidiphila rubida]